MIEIETNMEPSEKEEKDADVDPQVLLNEGKFMDTLFHKFSTEE